jgi:molecular chaperone DnaK
VARYVAESRCFQLEKLVKEQGDKLGAADKQAIESAIAKVREKAKGEDPQAIRSAISELEAASHAMSKAMYEKASAGASSDNGAAAGGPGAADEDVVDAEFEVKS